MKKTKIIALIVAIIALFAMLTVSVSAESVNGWQQDGDNWYYYENGEAKTGWFIAPDGNWYYAYEYGDGAILADTVEWIYGNYYRFDENGAMVTGWYSEVDDWGDKQWYYYNADGTAAYGWFQVDGKWYHADYDGQIYINGSYGFYNSTTEKWDYYRFDENGAMVTGWYLMTNDWGSEYWYYYHADGLGARGPLTLGGTQYVFYDDAQMVEGVTVVNVDDRNFYVDDNNAATELANNQWTEIDGEYYYVQDGVVCSGGFYDIGGYRYYFNWDGSMATNRTIYGGYDSETGREYYYRVSSWGGLVTGWYKDTQNGYWYYYGSDYNSGYGLTMVDGVHYWFDYDGRMIENGTRYYYDRYFVINGGVVYEVYNNTWAQIGEDWYYVQEGNFCYYGIYYIDGTMYYFNNCKLYSGAQIVYGEWLVSGNGSVVTTPGWNTAQYYDYGETSGNCYYVYVEEDGTLKHGWLDDNGKWYYMTPYMQYGTIAVDFIRDDETDEVKEAYLYAYTSSGQSIALVADGWYQTAYNWVYVRDGKVVTDEWIQGAGGAWYYVDSWGDMYYGGIYEIDGYRYYFDVDGRMLCNAWKQLGDSWICADESGALKAGVMDAQGYVFNYSGYLAISQVVRIDGQMRLTDANGVSFAFINDNGWTQVLNDWYYAEGGWLVNGSRYIAGNYFYFENGVMQTNYKTYDRYYGESGAAMNGWLYIDGKYYYAEGDYFWFDHSGIRTIDGVEYFFDNDYSLLVNDTKLYGSEIITTDANGVVVNRTDADGWIYQVNNGKGNLYYYENDRQYNGWLGDYYFYYDSGLATNTVIYYGDDPYYIDKNGMCVYNAWVKLGEYEDGTVRWGCAKADGTLYYNEWAQFGNTWYYFDGYVMLADTTYYIDGAYQYFGENGAWQYAIGNSITDGWVQENGTWYYYMAGNRTGGAIYDNGAWYYCTVDEGMLTNEFVDGFYYTANGTRANYTGWALIDGRWCYFSSLNRLAYGWVEDGGNTYYMASKYNEDTEEVEYGIVTGNQVIDGKVYYFADNGVLVYAYTSTGWIQIDDEWYYMVDGYVVTYENEYYIDGAYYAFEYGNMLYNTVCEGRLYGANGAMITADGWYLIDGDWYYVVDGYAANGIHLIGGVQYSFKNYVMQ